MRPTFLSPIVAAACLLTCDTTAEANPPPRIVYAPPPVYAPVRPVYRGVYVYPQITTGVPYAALYSSGYGYGGYSYLGQPPIYPVYPVYPAVRYGGGYSYDPFVGPTSYFWYRTR